MQPLDNICEWAFELINVLPNSTVTWDFGDGTISNGNAIASHIYDESGTYTISVTYYTAECPNGETLETIIQVEDCESSIDEFANDEWSVFPNPALTGGEIKISNSPNYPFTVQLMDIQGRIVATSNNNIISLNDISSGIFLLNILNEKNNIVVSTTKLVVQ